MRLNLLKRNPKPNIVTIMAIAKKEEEIEEPQQIYFYFKEKVSKIDVNLFKLMYDAQLKKMLAYIGLGISSFIPQLTIFFFVVGKVANIPSEATFPIVLLTFGFWLAEIFFSIAIVTKYHELMIMENKLNITLVHRDVFYRIRPIVAKLWDVIHRKGLVQKGIEVGIEEEERYRQTNWIISGVTFAIILFVTIIFVYILNAALYLKST